MTDTQRPWDRRTPDSDPAYEAFAAHLETGSLRDAYRQRSGNEKATSPPGAWTGWSTTHHWVSRRAAYVEWTVRECQDATQATSTTAWRPTSDIEGANHEGPR